MNEEAKNFLIEPELEARIVALVLGEASDFETEELNRFVAERPELAAFMKEMQQVHELMQTAAAGEFEAPDANWKLPTDRRNAVLAVIRGETPEQAAPAAVGHAAQHQFSDLPISACKTMAPEHSENTPSLTRRVRSLFAESLGPITQTLSRRMRRTPARIVAGICLAGLIGLMTVPSFFRHAYLSSQREFAAAGHFNERRHSFSFSVGTDFDRPLSTQAAASQGSADHNGQQQLIAKLESAAAASARASSTALSALQQTLSGGALAANTTNDSESLRSFAPTSEYAVPEMRVKAPLDGLSETEGWPAVGFWDRASAVAGANGATIPKLGDQAGFDLPAVNAPEPMEEFQEDLAKQRSLSLGQSENDSPMEQRGYAEADRRSGVEMFGKELELKQGSDRTGGASDSGTAEKRLNEWSDKSGESQDRSAPGKPRFGSGGFSGGGFGGDGFGGKPSGGTEGADAFAGSSIQPVPESGRHGRANADGVERDGKDAPADHAPGFSKQPSGAESGLFDRMYGYGTERGAEGLDSGLKRRKETPEENDPAIGLRFDDNTEGMQDLGLFILRGNEADVAQFEEAIREKDSGLAESLPRLEPALAAPLELNPGDDFIVDRLKGIVDPGRKNWEKERSEEKRRFSIERESTAKGRTNWYFRQVEGARPELAGSTDGEEKPVTRALVPSATLNETNAAAEAFSTFSLHVSDVSFKLAAAALARGEWPEAARIRIEEFVNAFDYGDPLPGKNEKVACVVEQAIHPFVQQRNVLRVSMRTAAEGRATSTPLHLTFVLDNSGSMERIDRQQTVRRAFTLLSQQLNEIDRVTLISFSRQPRLLGENISGTESGRLVELIEQLPGEGGTNIEAALQLAFEKAAAVPQAAGAQKRIVLLTDGAVNLGNANPESLSQMVESMRAAGIAFDTAGICAEGLNDEVLEALTRKGDGRYYLLDSLDDADDSFVQQIAGALRPSASNVKVQVEFNPGRVGQYKLLGFEKHLLKQEDFRNDAVDAAEMAAAEAGVAIYQFEAKPDGEGDVGSVSVRFRDLSTGQMVEHRWPIPYEPDAPRPDQASPSLRIATCAAMLAARLRGEALGESVEWQTLSRLIDGLPQPQQNDARVQQLRLMIEQARQLSK